MSSRTPMVRPVDWGALVVQLAILGLAVGVGFWACGRSGVILAATVYVSYSFLTRSILTRQHRAGISLVKRQRFEEAIARFQRSLEFFERYPWIDDYRSAVLLTPAAMCYREMALANIAFCYSQIGNGVEARRHYELCLARFPDCGVATAALRMMDSARNS